MNDRLKTKNKVLTIIITSIITLILLEIILQIISIIMVRIPLLSEKIINDNIEKNVFTILCIGSSNTAGEHIPDFNTNDYSYPSILYKRLNENYHQKKYKIINDGIPGATTLTLLLRLENNIKKYKPDMVISMIGGNDIFLTSQYSNNILFKSVYFLQKLKVYKVFIEGPYRLFKYYDEENIFKKNRFKKAQYYQDNIGHYSPILSPSVFLESFNFPGNNKNLKTAVIHYSRGRIADAIQFTNNALNKNNDLLSAKLFLAEIYNQISEYDESIKLYENILKTQKFNLLIYLRLAKFYELAKKFEKAENLYDEIIMKWPDNIEGYVSADSFFQYILSIKDEINDFNFSEKDYEEKIINYAKKIIELKPDNLLGYFLLGKHYNQAQEYGEAEQYLKRTFELENKNSYKGYFAYNEQPARYLADCYSDENKFDEAIKVLKSLLKYNNSAVYRHLGIIYNKINDEINANKMFDKANELDNMQYEGSFKENYRKICIILLEKKIKTIIMENPNRNIDRLKKILEGFNRLIFVSNEENFKKALENSSYDEFFEDLSAGDYGHCTEKGNSLIAENLIPYIIRNK
ncbi:MAG: tetratricopeptide repeat protein [Spirochaetes bacterium]|nr:tetratricopeptide repeat protein [Spirochaetota bacterium]